MNEKFNPFAIQTDSLELGRRLEPRQVFEQYLRPNMAKKGRKLKTIKSVERQLKEFEAWWTRELAYWAERGQIDIPRPVVASLTIRHLSAFQASMLEQGKPAGYVNRATAVVRQILRCAEQHGLITHAPRVDALVAPKAAPKVYLTDDHLTALWETAPTKWPLRRKGFGPLHYSPAQAWRCCLVLWVVYGLRTQELVPLEAKSKPLTWANIHDCLETPNPAGYTENEHGWLVYVPPKQSWVKSEPLYLPLTRHAKAALEIMRPANWTRDMPVCDWTFSSTSFYRTWHAWTRRAGIAPKVGERFLIKHLRKTCSTRMNNHRPGLAEYITGHASDRSGTNSVTSSVSQNHYVNAEEVILDGLQTLPVPACFDEILPEKDTVANYERPSEPPETLCEPSFRRGVHPDHGAHGVLSWQRDQIPVSAIAQTCGPLNRSEESRLVSQP